MTALSAQILEAAGRQAEGSLLAAKEFLTLGRRDAVDQTLRWLVSRGQLVKITPRQTPWAHHPDADAADLSEPHQEPQALSLRQVGSCAGASLRIATGSCPHPQASCTVNLVK